jgi:hypothetical protein
MSATEQPSHGASRKGDAALRAQNQWCSSRLKQHQGDIMTSKNHKKRYFKPKKPVNQMTEGELDEFANFVFNTLLGDIEGKKEQDDESR